VSGCGGSGIIEFFRELGRAWYFGGFSIMSANVSITVAHGDGIGPEIMEASLHLIQEAGARIDLETIEIGEKVYLRGNSSGIEPSSWESLRRTKVFYKAPITTPQGGGYKRLNVTARKMLGLYANIRPCVAYHPFIRTKHPGMDVLIVRENEEDCHAKTETLRSYNGGAGDTLSQGR
jgi:isocitrate dehydrogenase